MHQEQKDFDVFLVFLPGLDAIQEMRKHLEPLMEHLGYGFSRPFQDLFKTFSRHVSKLMEAEGLEGEGYILRRRAGI